MKANLLNGLVIGIILLVAYLIGKMFQADYQNSEKTFKHYIVLSSLALFIGFGIVFLYSMEKQ